MATDCQVAILTAGYRVELDARVAGLGPKAINVLPFAGSAGATERVELQCVCVWLRDRGERAAAAVSDVRGEHVAAGFRAAVSLWRGRFVIDGRKAMKGSEKPKKLQKKQAQKTLKERRAEKRAAAKQNRSAL